MRIGFDAKKIVSNRTGIGNYGRNMVNALTAACPDNRYVLFAPRRQVVEECLNRVNPSAAVSFAYSSARTAFGQEWWRCRGMVKDIARQHLDLFHGLSNELPWGIRQAGCKSVVTIHDLIFLRHPEYYSFTAREILMAKTTHACRRADKIIAISRQTRQDLLDFYRIPEEKIEVVYQDCHPAFAHRLPAEALLATRQSYHLPPRYLLCVGTIEPRKNQCTLVRALPLVRDEELHLVLIGKSTPYQQRVEAEARRLGVAQRLHILNNMPDDDLPALYQGCFAFVYPSFFEGFGIPVLEAISSGVPVIAATGSCLEEAGGPDSLYCNPARPERMAELCNQLLDHPDQAARMAAAGQAYARRFAPSAIAERLLGIYRQLLS